MNSFYRHKVLSKKIWKPVQNDLFYWKNEDNPLATGEMLSFWKILGMFKPYSIPYEKYFD